jgi:hypothetical protein
VALLTQLPDGSWLIEGRLDHFLEKWKHAQMGCKVVLPDKRPAVLCMSDEGLSVVTIHPEAWERVRAKVEPLLKAGSLQHPHRQRLCEFCGTELKLKREMNDCWVFWCTSCETAEIQAKRLVGGTLGQGETEKT